METVDVYTERGDLVTCSDCGKVMLLPYGADKCPACKKEGCLVWTDESLLADKPQTARETLFLLLETGSLFEKYWRDTRCFQSENIYTPAIKTLLDKLDVKLREGDTIPVEYQDCRSLEDFFRVVAGERPAKEEVSFSSDKEGNYYFNGRKV